MTRKREMTKARMQKGKKRRRTGNEWMNLRTGTRKQTGGEDRTNGTGGRPLPVPLILVGGHEVLM
jgi:hypothetical protein